MKRYLTVVSLVATFGGLAVTFVVFAIFCWLASRKDGLELLLDSAWGAGLLVAFVVSVVAGIAGVAGLLMAQQKSG
ncbi:hypothetical protein [Asticcacaulis sp. AC402]|uniref:hypothetical protein n=1 Tax=Asticcacaulis sp. AC402 TaxID=1282361 RepID=UPI0003C41158|nr:hypothetical protein [Asticcacaulis sp. AC402]ESQ77095.1 hypothetical protein ABAC402_01480 [Asticcacaulis sp. AC402]